MQIDSGWMSDIKHVSSPFYDDRPNNEAPSLLVIHNISLPPEQFGGPHIEQLFTGRLNADEHPYFKDIHRLKVSAHCLIRRDGEIVQFVSFDKRAWHAGLSSFLGRDRCNDYSIGIELEGSDYQAFTVAQYEQLAKITKLIMRYYPIIIERIAGHSDISPGRKSDPGPFFNWTSYLATVREFA